MYIHKKLYILHNYNTEKAMKLHKHLAGLVDLDLFNDHPSTNYNNGYDVDIHSSVHSNVAWESCAYQACKAL